MLGLTLDVIAIDVGAVVGAAVLAEVLVDSSAVLVVVAASVVVSLTVEVVVEVVSSTVVAVPGGLHPHWKLRSMVSALPVAALLTITLTMPNG